MKSALTSRPVYPVEDYEEMLNRAPQYRPKPGMFPNWKEATARFVFWLLISTALWIALFHAVAFGLRIVGLIQ